MAEPRQNSLRKFPRVNVASLQHVAAVVRLDHYRSTTAQAFANQGGDVTKIHQRRNLHALVRCGEAEVVDRVVGNREGMKVYLANAEVFARFYLLDTILEGSSSFSGLFVIDVDALAYVGIAGLGGNVDRAIDGS